MLFKWKAGHTSRMPVSASTCGMFKENKRPAVVELDYTDFMDLLNQSPETVQKWLHKVASALEYKA